VQVADLLMYATGSCTPLRERERERGVIATASHQTKKQIQPLFKHPQKKKKKKKKKNLATKTQPTRTHSNWEPNPFVRPSICLFVCLID
jgi:hypothetical protein